MASKSPSFGHDDKGEKDTTTGARVGPIPGFVVPILKVNHVLLVPWIVFSLSSAALFQSQVYLAVTLIMAGLAGMILRIPTAASIASACLLVLIVWGKIASDLYGLPGEDSAIFLLQFLIVIFLMEASNSALLFDAAWTKLSGKQDELSSESRTRLTKWMSSQLLSLGKFTTATFGLSIGLLLLGGFVNVSFNYIGLSGTLVIATVIAIFILLTYRREPEERTVARN